MPELKEQASCEGMLKLFLQSPPILLLHPGGDGGLLMGPGVSVSGVPCPCVPGHSHLLLVGGDCSLLEVSLVTQILTLVRGTHKS